MIDIIITSYNEPKATLRAVNTFLNQTKRKDLRITVVDPFPEVEEFLRKNIKDKRFNFYLDPGEGKSYALNLLFQELGSDNKDDIFISTDGDVHVSDNAIQEIERAFKDEQVGVVTARPVSIDSRNTKYGYWSHLVFDGIDRVRRRLSFQKKFFLFKQYALRAPIPSKRDVKDSVWSFTLNLQLPRPEIDYNVIDGNPLERHSHAVANKYISRGR